MSAYRDVKEKDFRSFSLDLKEDNINGLLIFQGQEGFLIKWAVEQLVAKYVAEGFKELDYVKLPEDASLDTIVENVETLSMISPRRVVWIDNYRYLLDEKTKGYSQDEVGKLREFLSSYEGNNLIVLSYEDLNGKGAKLKTLGGTVYQFDRLESKELYAFINKRIKNAGKQIDRNDLALMVELSGYYNKESQYRLYNFENDIMKLIAHSNEEIISREDVMAAMNGDLDTFVFNFIEALSSKQKDRSFTLMNNLLNSGTNFFQLIALIGNQFELMLEILELEQEGMPFGNIVSELGIHEFRVKKAYKAAKGFTMESIKRILCNLYEIDSNIKSGNMDPNTALELFVAKV